MCVCSLCVSQGEWVSGLWVDVHLDIYVSKRDNTRPPRSELYLPWIVACAAAVCSPQSAWHALAVARSRATWSLWHFQKPQDLLEFWHPEWHDCKILNEDDFWQLRTSSWRNWKPCCGNSDNTTVHKMWAVKQTGESFMWLIENLFTKTEELFSEKVQKKVENEVQMETTKHKCELC